MNYPSEMQQKMDRDSCQMQGVLIGASRAATLQAQASMAQMPVDSRSPVEKAMTRAHQRMEHLEGVIDELVRRLEPVSNTANGAGKNDSMRPMGECPLAEQLEQIAEHASRLSAYVVEARERLCI